MKVVLTLAPILIPCANAKLGEINNFCPKIMGLQGDFGKNIPYPYPQNKTSVIAIMLCPMSFPASSIIASIEPK